VLVSLLESTSASLHVVCLSIMLSSGWNREEDRATGVRQGPWFCQVLHARFDPSLVGVDALDLRKGDVRLLSLQGEVRIGQSSSF
jgi:hypothetical protein